MNYLLVCTLVAPYYFYPHLARLFVSNNGKGNHIRFCKNALLILNFGRASYGDVNGCSIVAGLCVDMSISLIVIIQIFNDLLKYGVYVQNIGFRLKELSRGLIIYCGGVYACQLFVVISMCLHLRRIRHILKCINGAYVQG